MKLINTSSARGLLVPLLASRGVQAAKMVLRPGESSSDEPENEHPKSEQWLLVISGRGKARVGRRTLQLKAGSLLLIEKGESHQITCMGRKPLVTLNFYAPPAYGDEGEVRKAVT